MSKYNLILLAILLTYSCKQNCPPESYDPESVRLEAVLMLKQYHDAIAQGGLLAEFDYLDNSDDFFWVPPGYRSALSYDSVNAILKQNALMFSQVNFYWETLDVKPLHHELASFTGIVSGIMTDTSGTQSQMRIIESGTLIKRNDGWKLLNGQSALLETDENSENVQH
jgi:hypothetical protein